MLDKIKWIWESYKKYKYILFVLVLLTPIQAFLQVLFPRIIEFMIDYLKTGNLPEYKAVVWLTDTGAGYGWSVTGTFAVTLVVLGVISVLLYAFVQSHRAWMNMKLEWSFRQRAFNKITEKGPDFFNKFRVGDILTRLTDDVAEKLSWFACSGIFRFYEALIYVAFTITMMITIDPILTVWTVMPLPILIVVFFKSATVLDKRYDRLQTRISTLNDIVEACFAGVRVVKAYTQEKAQRQRFDEAIRDRREAEISAVKATTVVHSLYMYIWQFGIIIVLMAGGYMVINANLTLGKLIAFVYYVVYLVFPMFDIGQFLVKSRQSAVSINRLQELENAPVMIDRSGAIPTNGDIGAVLSFENASFSFPDSDRQIIDGLTLNIKQGQKVAVVGRVGSGKSWLVNLIPRLVDPSNGSVRLGKNRLNDLNLASLRRKIGFVPQEPVLFSDTIKNNIVFGRDEIKPEQIDWAIRISQLESDLEDFPKGLDTQIGTRGVALSGGQKQRLSLARALVGNPKILILDDCTSALDSKTEAALWNQLEKVMPDRTVVMITHRPDALEKADVIFVLEEGRLVETGTHFELILKEGVYAKLYKKYCLEQQISSIT